MAAEAIRVLVVDDHAVVREGLRTFLQLQDGIEVVGEAADGEQAVARATELEPDVILMDLVMPQLDGIDAMRELRRRSSASRVIVLTSFLDDERLMPALEAGAAGYLLKDVEPAELARAVRSACAGEALIDPTVASRLLNTLSGDRGGARNSRSTNDSIETLTRREREVLELIALGHSNKRIALELGVAEKTVKTHVGHMLAKLGVADRTQAALLAVQHGLSGGRGPEDLGPIATTNSDRTRRTVGAMSPTAIITGASRGLGLALARALADRGYRLVIDARGAPDLERAARELEAITHVRALPGDVADDWHRGALIDAAGERVDVLVNNASTLGPSPQPELTGYPLDALRRVYEVNVVAPLALAQLAVPLMPAGACVINVTSDAAVEPYEGWGGYGSSKAALEQLSAILAGERPGLRVYTVDPGDMRTQMHQEAFPGEDISDRPPPEESVPGLVELIESALPSGRYRAREVLTSAREVLVEGRVS